MDKEQIKWLSGGRQQGKTYQLIKDQQKEIKKLNKEKDDLDDCNRHLYNENKRLNNIIDELEKDLVEEIKSFENDGYDKEENRKRSLWLAGCYDQDKRILEKLKELKEGK